MICFFVYQNNPLQQIDYDNQFYIDFTNTGSSSMRTKLQNILNKNGDWVYFVHSYQFLPRDPDHLLASYSFGGRLITAAVRKGNITGVQFHPESILTEHGHAMLKNFLESA